MTTTEHLARITAKCRANLALAEKRTQGEWQHGEATSPGYIEHFVGIDGVNTAIAGDILDGARHPSAHNARYIAACAGAAEAGWRATIAAIQSVEMVNRGSAPSYSAREQRLIAAILNAWPEDLL